MSRLRTVKPLSERFWPKVKMGPECWEWLGSLHSNGYGQFSVGRRANHMNLLAHRVSYELSGHVIPNGLQLDHLCRNRSCVRPSHLEPVTAKENVLRGIGITARNAVKTHCGHGHEFSGNNLRINPDGSRCCRTCARAADLRSKDKKLNAH